MKVIKLTADARADIERARSRTLPKKIDYSYPFYGEEYRERIQGKPHVVEKADVLLGDAVLWERSNLEPVLMKLSCMNAEFFSIERKSSNDHQRTLFLYQNCFYDVIGQLREDQMRLLILEAADKERQLFERLKAKFESQESREVKTKRERIPEAVRVAVWRRDEGQCARCGSCERLEYDHIIPIDRGGSNTVRNVELLCETHNRQKSNNIE